MTVTAPQYRRYSTRQREAWREDYSDMRSWGMNHDEIANRLGIKRDSLMRRCARHDIYIPEWHERPAFDRLDELIESGRPFTSGDLPLGQPGVNVAALRHAIGTGRIQVIGFEVGPQGGVSHRRKIWQAVQADMAVAS